MRSIVGVQSRYNYLTDDNVIKNIDFPIKNKINKDRNSTNRV